MLNKVKFLLTGKKLALWSMLAAITIASCNSKESGLKKAKNGLQYKIVAGTSKDSLLKKGDVISFSVIQKMGDSVAFNSYEGGHQIGEVDTVVNPLDFRFIFKEMRVGDSAYVKISVDSVYNFEKNRAMQGDPNFKKDAFDKNVPEFYKKKGNFVSIGVRVLDKYVVDSTKPAFKADTARLNAFNKLQQEKQQAYQMKAQKKKQTEDSVAAVANKAAGTKFLTENKNKAGVITTASGLQYQIIKQGTGAKPTANDQFKAHYVGTLLNGTEFDNSIKRGEPLTMPLAQVVQGWQEVLQLMPVGSKYKVWIPSNLGYGDQGSPTIPAGSTLVFEMELLDIPKAQPKQPGAGGQQIDPETLKKMMEQQKQQGGQGQ
jgi:FKBP-type peptidyl-prolyl cis-trans isomerase